MRIPGWSSRPGRSGAETPPPPRERPEGKVVLGRYLLDRFLGAGSNADVFLARRTDGGPGPVVVKRIKDHVAEAPRFRHFFDAEVTAMRRFQHPYAVQLIDAALDDPFGPCLVLEYIDGVTVEAVVNHEKRLHPDRVALYVGCLCHALQAAHDAGIVHRDLKPANVMVTGYGTPAESLKVMDFGFAGFAAKPHIQIAELTGVGSVFACGTPAYVSPEMVRGDAVDGRADLYAVGVMLFEMLTGRLPFDHPTVEEVIAAHVQERPPRFNRIGSSDVSPGVEGVAQLALSKFPNERQQTARELAAAYGRAIGYDLWEATAPAGYVPPAAATTDDRVAADTPAPGTPDDEFTLFDRFEALLPERLAAVKLRGFVDDVGGEVVDSEPGLIRMRVGPPGTKAGASQSGLLGWITAKRRPHHGGPGHEPIEVRLQMEKMDANRVAVVVSFHPVAECQPGDVCQWRGRCEGLYDTLRSYLMPG